MQTLDLTVEHHTEYNHNRIYLVNRIVKLLHYDGGVGLFGFGIDVWIYLVIGSCTICLNTLQLSCILLLDKTSDHWILLKYSFTQSVTFPVVIHRNLQPNRQ